CPLSRGHRKLLQEDRRPAGADVAKWRRPVSPAGQRAGPGPCSKGAVPAHSCMVEGACMPVRHVLFVMFVFSSVSLAVDLRPLNGKPVSGELVSFNTKEIVLKTASGPVTTSLSQVLQLDLEPLLGPGKDAKYQDVELTDGTLLHCGQFAIKSNQVEQALLSPQQNEAP